MFQLILVWLVTGVSLFILSRLPLGIEIDKFGSALVAALVLGLLNALLKPVLSFIAFPLTLLTFGLFALVINAIIFALAAALVEGFRLRWGIWSALLGSLCLSILNSLLFRLL
ncbi:MAG: phage holin family protein [Nitrospinota bacterium]|nr:MAG: phage holin family protein [Nitrospinota bacterium]